MSDDEKRELTQEEIEALHTETAEAVFATLMKGPLDLEPMLRLIFHAEQGCEIPGVDGGPGDLLNILKQSIAVLELLKERAPERHDAAAAVGFTATASLLVWTRKARGAVIAQMIEDEVAKKATKH